MHYTSPPITLMYHAPVHLCMGEKKQAAARIDEEKYNELRAHAASQGMSLADWLRAAIEEKAESEELDLGNSKGPMAALAD